MDACGTLRALPAGHHTLAASITRFIVFDGAGFVLMAAALVSLVITRRRRTRGSLPGLNNTP